MVPHLLHRKQTHFVLWRPGASNPPPKLIIGTFKAGDPPTLGNQQIFTLTASSLSPDLFEIAAADCNLIEGAVYHYWFEITDTNAYVSPHAFLRVTDPTAYSVDWRLTCVFPLPYNSNPGVPTENEAPAAVVRFSHGKLIPADPVSQPSTFDTKPDSAMADLPPNNRLVIYELPTAWTKSGDLLNATNVGVGTFQDVIALIDKTEAGAHFVGVPTVSQGQHLIDLGINALELLPPAAHILIANRGAMARVIIYLPILIWAGRSTQMPRL